MNANDSDFPTLEKRMPSLFEQMREDLQKMPICRTFLLLYFGRDYESDELDFAYFFEDHKRLEINVVALESAGYVKKIASHPAGRYKMSERFVGLLRGHGDSRLSR